MFDFVNNLHNNKIIKMLNGKSILITGGTGSFGKKFTETILKKYPNVKRLVIYSRDELKQFEMSQVYSPAKYKGIRYFIGDIRDGERFKRACEGIDVIIHAAALKQVPTAEYNPMEAVKSNVMGAENVINAMDNAERKILEELKDMFDIISDVFDCTVTVEKER